MALSVSRVLLCVFLVFWAGRVAAQENRVALVVGNSAYSSAPALANTINDAKAVGDALERLGFEVFSAFDAPQASLLNTFSEFSRALGDADAAVFYYAGHGVQVGAENYILPVDIEVQDEFSVQYGALSLTDVVRDMERDAAVAIVILDACRNNPFADILAKADPTRAAFGTRGLAPIPSAGSGTIIAYAAAPGAVASDGEGEHSPYTAALLEEMETPGVEVGLLFRRVAGRVIEETEGKQRPELLVRLASEYYLAGVPSAPQGQAGQQDLDAGTIIPANDKASGAGAGGGPALVASLAPAPGRTTVATERSDRPALWGYAATLVEIPFDVPGPAWAAPDGRQVAELEPNNSFGWAQTVSPNDTIEMTIGEKGESDWLEFEVGHGGRLTLSAPQTPGNIDLSVRLLNGNGDELAYWQAAPRPGGALRTEYDLPAAGTYLLELADGGRDEWSEQTFSVSLSYQVQDDRFEPNDRIDQAWHLPLSGTHRINLLPRGDADMFRFTVTEPGALHVSATGVPETLDTALRLLNADGVEVAYWVFPPRQGGDTVAQFDLPRPGVYYLHTVDNGNDGSAIASLTLSTRFEPSSDPLEPNDSMAQATPVAPDGQHAVTIFPRGDGDWLELEILQPGELSLAATGVPQSIDLAYRVLDSAGAELQYWIYAPRPGGDLTGTADIARPGRYFLQLVDNGNDGSDVSAFPLAIGFEPSLDAFEPNDGIGSASVLTPGGEVPFTILPRGDGDWFRVNVDNPGELKVWIDEGPPNLDITYRVLGSDWNELAYWVTAYAMGGLTEGSVDLPSPGTYFIEVRDNGNDGRSVEPATLRTVFTPIEEANEPNNRYGDATPVAIEGETLAHILPRGDGDWHKFEAPGPGTLEVRIDNVPPALSVTFRVVNADGAEALYWVAPAGNGGDTIGEVPIPAAGWYFMEIRESGDDARATEAFRITRTFTPAG